MRRPLKTIYSIGLMSGTSLDGIDGVLIRARPKGQSYSVSVLNHQFRPYPSAWSARIRKISDRNELRAAHRFGSLWAETAADLAWSLCEKTGMKINQIHCIGAHGQTAVHLPEPKNFLNRNIATSIQLLDISRLALRTKSIVVGNFRTADIAAGGEGAPLTPHAHRLLFSQRGRRIGILNIGGMANLTVLKGREIEQAFDLGPGNTWIDWIVRKKTRGRLRMDRNGLMARAGNPKPRIMKKLLRHPYFKKRPPKSCGWEEFGEGFLAPFEGDFSKLTRNDAIATVTHATSWAIADIIYQTISTPRNRLREVITAGGGAKNRFLLELLSERLPTIPITTSSNYDIGVSEVEAIAFALFAIETLRGNSVTEPRATGASEETLSGEIAFGDGRGLL